MELDIISAMQPLADRGIKQHISEVYGAVMDEAGNHYYPRTLNGVTNGYKKRGSNKQFSIVGSGNTNEFFGQHLLRGSGGKVFITEGEIDAMSAAQALVDGMEPDKLKRFGFPAVISVPDGVSSAKKIFSAQKSLLEGYKEIILVPDADEAGRAMVNIASEILDRQKVRVVSLPQKDPNEMLQKGLEDNLRFLMLAKATMPVPEKLIWGDDISLERLQAAIPAGFAFPQYPGLTRKLKGLRSGPGASELTILCSGSGMGKTTMTHEMAWALRKYHDLAIGQIRLEETVVKSSQALIAIDNDIPLAKLRSNPNAISQEQWEKSRESLLTNHRVAFLDHFGSLDSHRLVDHFKFLSYSAGCKVIFLDHISMVVSGSESKFGERKDIDILMTSLASFVEQSGTSVVAVVHLKRPEGDASYNEGHPITLSALRGSAGLEQLSHNVIALEGKQSEGDGNRRTSKLLKNREWGELGHCEDLIYYPMTGRLLSVEV